MAKKLQLELDESQRRELEEMRDHHPRPYLREQAAALIKIADGVSGRRVALVGLLKPRDPDAIYRWVHRYQEGGASNLRVKRGRGRKPAFSP
jgi:transposase